MNADRARRSDQPRCAKRPFPSAHAAKIGHRHAGYRIRPYWCEDCRAWHVTNAEKRENFKR